MSQVTDKLEHDEKKIIKKKKNINIEFNISLYIKSQWT